MLTNTVKANVVLNGAVGVIDMTKASKRPKYYARIPKQRSTYGDRQYTYFYSKDDYDNYLKRKRGVKSPPSFDKSLLGGTKKEEDKFKNREREWVEQQIKKGKLPKGALKLISSGRFVSSGEQKTSNHGGQQGLFRSTIIYIGGKLFKAKFNPKQLGLFNPQNDPNLNLLPSKKNPKIKRWQRTNEDESLFDFGEKGKVENKEVEKQKLGLVHRQGKETKKDKYLTEQQQKPSSPITKKIGKIGNARISIVDATPEQQKEFDKKRLERRKKGYEEIKNEVKGYPTFTEKDLKTARYKEKIIAVKREFSNDESNFKRYYIVENRDGTLITQGMKEIEFSPEYNYYYEYSYENEWEKAENLIKDKKLVKVNQSNAGDLKRNDVLLVIHPDEKYNRPTEKMRVTQREEKDGKWYIKLKLIDEGGYAFWGDFDGKHKYYLLEKAADKYKKPKIESDTTYTKKSGIVEVRNIYPKPYVLYGKLHERKHENNWNADVKKNKQIRIFGEFKEGKKFDRVFKIGDTVEIGSYNLIYTGEILSISEKTVTIDDSGRKKRMSLYDFINKNYDLDLEKISKHNQNEMYYI